MFSKALSFGLITSLVIHLLVFLPFKSSNSAGNKVRRSFDVKIRATQKSAPKKVIKKSGSKKVTKSNISNEDKDSQVVSVSKNFDNQIVSFVAPTYPIVARRRGVEGEVLMAITVDQKGDVVSSKILKEADYQPFNQSVLEVVTNWKFKAQQQQITFNKKIIFVVN